MLYGVVRRVQRAWWRLRKPQTIGVRAVVQDSAGSVLLVRHTYSTDGSRWRWYLPGGGVKRSESLIQALRRELLEEVGVEIAGNVRLAGVYSSELEHKRDHIVLFTVEGWRAVPSASGEIAESGFFAVDGLPDKTSPATRRRLDEVLQGEPVDFKW
jgi:ADP-ribose pyrophosphatase YjhB (NUDIX family)